MIDKKIKLQKEIFKYINKENAYDGVPSVDYRPKSGDVINSKYNNPIIVLVIGDIRFTHNILINKKDSIEVSEKFKSPILFLDYEDISLDLYNYIVNWQYEFNGIFKYSAGREAEFGKEDWQYSLDNRKKVAGRIFISTDGIGKIVFRHEEIDTLTPRSMRNRDLLNFSKYSYLSSPSDLGTRFHSTGITRKRIK